MVEGFGGTFYFHRGGGAVGGGFRGHVNRGVAIFGGIGFFADGLGDVWLGGVFEFVVLLEKVVREGRVEESIYVEVRRY